MVSAADWVTAAEVADILTFCTVVTAIVVTVNAALVRPAGTVTCDGTVAFALLLASVTGVPPAGAAAARFTVQVALAPPLNVLGAQTTEETPG